MKKENQKVIGLRTLIETLDMDAVASAIDVMKHHQLSNSPQPGELPAHWIWTDDGVINPDNVLYVQLDGPQTKIRMVEGKMYLNGDPFGLTQRTKPREKPKDLEDD